MPKVSIIIPVYKAERFLHRCLKSVLAQTYLDWECILVDDGSPDNSGMLCDEYAKQDSRFKVFHTQNHGASAARNYGIDHACGAWVCFIDSDDWVDEKYVEHLEYGTKDDVDVVFTNYLSCQHIQNDSIKDSKEMLDYMIDNNIFAMSSPFAKFFKLSFLKRNLIKFPVEIHMGEDAIFNTLYMFFVNKACFLSYCDYHYNLQTEGSLSSRYYGFEEEYLCFKLWRNAELRLFEKYYSHTNALKHVWKVRLSSQFKRVYQSIFKTNEKKTYTICASKLRKFEKEYLEEYAQYGVEKKFAGFVQKFLLSNKFYGFFVFFNLFFFRNYKKISVDK